MKNLTINTNMLKMQLLLNRVENSSKTAVVVLIKQQFELELRLLCVFNVHKTLG